MNWLKYFIILALFFIFSLLQASFFSYFAILGAIPNLVFVLFFTLIFFEPRASYAEGLAQVAIAGIVSDMFLPSYFGVSVVAFLAVYFFQMAVDHFLREDQNKSLVFYFISIFSVSYIVYQAVLYALSLVFDFPFNLNVILFIGLAYSLVFAIISFYIGKAVFTQTSDNQLKLL